MRLPRRHGLTVVLLILLGALMLGIPRPPGCRSLPRPPRPPKPEQPLEPSALRSAADAQDTLVAAPPTAGTRTRAAR